MSAPRNLLDIAPPTDGDETFETLFENPQVRIERIASNRHASPDGFWYEQPRDEWVALLRGEAVLAFADGRRIELKAGDWVTIPTSCRHRVEATGPDAVWLAVHAATDESPGSGVDLPAA